TFDAHTPALVAQTGAFSGGGTGNFGFGVLGAGQPSGGAGIFSSPILGIHIANATVADVTAPNNSGNIFVVGVISSFGIGNTGPGAAPVQDVSGSAPDSGATIAIFGAALGGLIALRRRLA